MKEIIISKNENSAYMVLLLEDGKIVEKYDESESNKILEGNIYCGIVKNVLPGMQSAFVDIGEDKNAFLHIKDVIPKVSNETGNKKEDFSKYKINDYIKQGMPILVQIKKDEEAQKGARISTHISLTGRFCVLMVDVNFITISQKIENSEERKRLRKIASEILNKQEKKFGVIIRTASEGKKKEEIEEDLEKLITLWKLIKESYDTAKKQKVPKLICQNYDVVSKFLTGVLDTGIAKITINSKTSYQEIEKYLKSIEKDEIQLEYKKNLNNIYDIDNQIEKMERRKVWLDCGGFITIDKTEALTAIDVNSGKFTGKKNSSKENTVVKVNEEATIEIAKQLRLRNISGIIVIDYIDMENDQDRNEIIKLLEKEIKKDRSKTQIIGFTKLDLLEMTRKKM